MAAPQPRRRSLSSRRRLEAPPLPLVPAATTEEQDEDFKLGTRGLLVFLALCVCTFLSALDLTAVSTVLPALAERFASPDYAWVGSAYALSSTALIPWVGGISAIVGRRPAVLASLLFFAAGSAITGAAPSMAVVIVGRTIQGVGGGGILVLTEIVICDLVPLSKRAMYFGLVGAVWAIASAIGPPVGGAFSDAGAFRWLFYMNLPVCGVAGVLVLCFMNLKRPPGTAREQFQRMDWLNLLFCPAATGALLGLTWAGKYAWSSVQVLVPLVLGLAGIFAFFWLERYVRHPTIPFNVLGHRTAIIGHVSNFLHSIVTISFGFYMPIYFQAARGSSAVRSGVQLLPAAFTIAPAAVVTGFAISLSGGHYKLFHVAGFALLAAGCGTFLLLDVDSATAVWICVQIFFGVGAGLLYAALQISVLAPLEPCDHAQAMAFFTFIRTFAQSVAIAVSSTALQSGLNKHMPEVFSGLLQGQTHDTAYAAIPLLKNLEPQLRLQVQVAFVKALQNVWRMDMAVALAGMVLVAFMTQMKLATTTDARYGLEDRAPAELDVEKDPQEGWGRAV